MPPRAGAISRRVFVGGAIAGAVAGCSRAPRRARPLELSFWTGFTGGDGPPMRRLVDAFNARHSDVRVVMITMRWDDLYRRLPLLRLGGRAPDVGVVHQHRLPSVAARAVLSPLDGLLAPFALSAELFDPTAWRAGAWRGRRYGIPLDLHPLATYFNLDAFARAGIDAAPATREALDEAVARLVRAGFEHPLWMPAEWPAHLVFESLCWQHGGAPFAADGSRVTIASDAGAEAIAWMRSVVERGWGPRSLGIDAQWNAFVNGTNAITFDGSWMLQSLGAVAGGAGVAPFPRIGPSRAVWANGHHLVLFNGTGERSERVEASMTFVAWLSAESLAWAEAGQLPARTDVRRGAAFAALGGITTLAAQLPDVRLVPSAPGVGEIQDDAIVFAVSSAMRARAPRDALVKAEALANDQLASVRASLGGAA